MSINRYPRAKQPRDVRPDTSRRSRSRPTDWGAGRGPSCVRQPLDLLRQRASAGHRGRSHSVEPGHGWCARPSRARRLFPSVPLVEHDSQGCRPHAPQSLAQRGGRGLAPGLGEGDSRLRLGRAARDGSPHVIQPEVRGAEPVMLFPIVFGLSMDYEVFLISRIHEEWTHTRHAKRPVREGPAVAGRVITPAPTIMIRVFLAFVSGGDRGIS
jgi:MMPL family